MASTSEGHDRLSDNSDERRAIEIDPMVKRGKRKCMWVYKERWGEKEEGGKGGPSTVQKEGKSRSNRATIVELMNQSPTIP